MAFIDDLVVVIPPERATDADAVENVTAWLHDQREPCGIQLNREKPRLLLPQGIKPQDVPEPARAMLRRTGVSVAPDGMTIVGVPVGSAEYQRQQALEAMRGEPTELLRSLAQMEDAQASFQILRVSASTRMNFPLRTLPPDVIQESARGRRPGRGDASHDRSRPGRPQAHPPRTLHPAYRGPIAPGAPRPPCRGNPAGPATTARRGVWPRQRC